MFERFWRDGLLRYDETKGIDWSWLAMDGAMTKAPLAGSKKTGPNPKDRGKQGVKRSVLTEGSGIPVALAIDGANRHDMKLVQATLERIMTKRPMPTEASPQGLCLDKGYDYDEVRAIVKESGFTAHIRACGKTQRPSSGKRASGRAAGWSSERTAG